MVDLGISQVAKTKEEDEMKEISRKERTSILRGAEDAFFRAMLAGYLRKKRDPNDPGVKVSIKKVRYSTEVTAHVDADYLVIDSWVKSSKGYSSGTTTILFRSGLVWEPVWSMSYVGHYPDEAIPLLKMALRVEYQARNFRGGRGASTYIPKTGSLFYRNEVKGPPQFNWFAGHEYIMHQKSRDIIGEHEYLGRALI